MTQSWRLIFALATCLVSALLIGLMATVGYAQLEGTIQITAPADGAVVSPGETINVAVNTTDPCSIVAIIAEYPIPDALLTSPPWNFSITIPTHIAPREYTLTAICTTTPEQLIESRVDIFVENPNPAVKLISEPKGLSFNYVGEQSFITVVATYPDGQSVTVSQSSTITYTSNDTAVAVVNSDGQVTATGPGTTTIRASYGGKTVDVPVSVPQSSPGDLNGDGRIDQDDLNIILSDLNMPATGPYDARDLNHDGIIDQQDAQAQVSLCTGSPCTIPVPPPPPPPVDTTPPVLSLPGAVTVDATSPTGAIVNFTATATDAVSGAASVTCTPPSGTSFPIKTTTVACSASDTAGNSASGSFSVTVRGASDQLRTLISVIDGLGLRLPLQLRLKAGLNGAATALKAGPKGQPQACGPLNLFLRNVLNMSGRELTAAQANQLTTDATRIKAVIGCR